MKGLKRKIDNSVVDFDSSLYIIDRIACMKTIKDTEDIDDTINQLDLIDIYRLFYLIHAKNTFFSNSHRKKFWTYNILVHKTSINTFKE